MAAAGAHVMVVSFLGQGNINPQRNLAQRIAAAADGSALHVTISVPVSSHRMMFPGLARPDDDAIDAAGFSYVPYSDGFDDGFDFFTEDPLAYAIRSTEVGRATLSTALDRLAARGRPVTFIVTALMMPWVVDFAADRGIPWAQFWSQPAAVHAVYYHYFRGYASLITGHAHELDFTVAMAELPPLKIRDLPSFLQSPDARELAVIEWYRKTLGEGGVAERRGTILVNTFEELEFRSVALFRAAGMKVLPIGPVLPKASSGADVYKADKTAYIEWLDTQAAKSVVYVSFGSLSSFSRRQIEEITQVLRDSGRPYLWVLRKNNRELEGVVDVSGIADGEKGLVVEWCNQVAVLSHPSVGCFVTHCGWNSTLEGISCGVPMVAVPQWSDQPTNAALVARHWRNGVRGEVDGGDRVLKAEELKRCLELVMGDGDAGEEIRRNAGMWKEKAAMAVGKGGSSERNFRVFMEEVICRKLQSSDNY